MRTKPGIQHNYFMKMTIFFTLILSIFAVSACQTAPTQKAENTSVGNRSAVKAVVEIKQIAVTDAKKAIDEKDVQFIDVRTTEEYAAGHAAKASNFPLDVLDRDLGALDKGKPVYVICQTGKRGQIGAEILQKAGFTDIYNISGGTSAWVNAGFQTEK